MLCMMIKQIALLIIMNHGMIMSCSWWVVLWEWHEDGIKYEDKFYYDDMPSDSTGAMYQCKENQSQWVMTRCYGEV